MMRGVPSNVQIFANQANFNQANKVWVNGMGITTASTLSTCNNQCDGTGTVTVAGGVSPFTYLWDDPAEKMFVLRDYLELSDPPKHRTLK